MSVLMQVTGLYRYYAQHCVINNVSFNLKKGQVLGFLGVNGAGKTTTLKMLSGNLVPSAGEIKINGINLRQHPLQAKRVLGYLPEIPPLYQDLTVDEFLNYVAKLHRIPKALIQTALCNTKERCGLMAVSKQLIVHLSKGYQQRVGIAQAILHKPEVIILDEPTVGLDPIQIKATLNLIKTLGVEHGIILSTHILSAVQESCSDVQIIHQGKLVLKKTVAELNQQINHSRLKLTTRKAIDLSQLKSITAITQVESFAINEYIIHYKRHDNPIERLTELIIAHGWGLEEIAPLKGSLEDIFFTLTV
jgi:ABC-2 type transport system ATP-binding protein